MQSGPALHRGVPCSYLHGGWRSAVPNVLRAHRILRTLPRAIDVHAGQHCVDGFIRRGHIFWAACPSLKWALLSPITPRSQGPGPWISEDACRVNFAKVSSEVSCPAS